VGMFCWSCIGRRFLVVGAGYNRTPSPRQGCPFEDSRRALASPIVPFW
jgi:hypothetical protein